MAVELDVSPATEAHLRAILETQPVCLTRVQADGTFLAVNEAALAMLGGTTLDQVLGTSIAAVVVPDDRAKALAFVERVAAGERGSLEVSVSTLTGTRHAMQLHAVPLADAPDGVDSVLLTLRDVTEHRVLEKSLVEAVARQEEQAAALAAEKAELVAALEAATQGRNAELAAEYQARMAALDQEGLAQRARISELEQRLRESQERYETEAAARGETEGRLAAQLTETRQRAEREIQEHTARLASLEQAITEAERRHTALVEQHRSEQLAWKQAQAESDTAHAAKVSELSRNIEALEAAVRDLDAQHAEREHALRSELQRVSSLLQQAEGERTRLEGLLEGAAAEMQKLEEQRRAFEAQHGEIEEERQRLDQMLRQAAMEQHVLARALAQESGHRRHAEQRLQRAVAMASQLATSLGETAPQPTDVGALLERMEPSLKTLLGSIDLAVLAAPGSLAVIADGDLEQALLSIVVNRQAALVESGALTFEVAPVDIDEGLAQEFGGVRPGAYLLVAVHASGADAASGLPDDLFDRAATPEAWQEAGASLAAAASTVAGAGGHVWLRREGNDAVAVELYLPRAATE